MLQYELEITNFWGARGEDGTCEIYPIRIKQNGGIWNAGEGDINNDKLWLVNNCLETQIFVYLNLKSASAVFIVWEEPEDFIQLLIPQHWIDYISVRALGGGASERAFCSNNRNNRITE